MDQTREKTREKVDQLVRNSLPQLDRPGENAWIMLGRNDTYPQASPDVVNHACDVIAVVAMSSALAIHDVLGEYELAARSRHICLAAPMRQGLTT